MSKFSSRLKSFSTWIDSHLSTPFKITVFVAGSLFALDQLLYQANQGAKSTTEAAFAAVVSQLDSDNGAIQASALRSLYDIANSSFIAGTQSGSFVPYGHLVRWASGSRERPFYRRSRSLFIEFGRVPRKSDSGTLGIVSSTHLATSATWAAHEYDLSYFLASKSPSFFYALNAPEAKMAALDLKDQNFGPANLRESSFYDCTFMNTGFAGADLTGIRVTSGIWDRVTFTGATLVDSTFRFVNLRSANFAQAKIARTTFVQSNLINSNFTAADLTKSDFRGTMLSGANFQGAILGSVRFDQSDISNAMFAGADLHGADFSNAVGFDPAQIEDAVNKDQAILPNTEKGED